MALRRTAVEEVGLLDEEIFVYMDDVDLCERVRAAGWSVWYAPDTTATHFMGASSRRVVGSASLEALRALNRWFTRRHGSRAGAALRALEVAGFGARVIAYGTQSLVRDTPHVRAQMRAHAARVRLALERVDV
jgi:GT2 family glycosyltransferase